MRSKRAISKYRKLRQTSRTKKLDVPVSPANRVKAKQPSRFSFITFLTDFGLNDTYVGVMKGIVAGINPAAIVIDLCHEIAPRDINSAAFLLAASYPFFPEGTVHVAVVDPGVGTGRRALCVQAGKYFFIGPDNGVISLACYDAGPPKIFLLENESYFLEKRSKTFHGRDIFSPVAAYLSAGTPIESFGREIRSMKRIRPSVAIIARHSLQGEIMHIDRFGNIITNIREEDVSSAFGRTNRNRLIVTCGGHRIYGLRQTYGDVEPGLALALFGSYNLMEIAVSSGNAASALDVKLGDDVWVKHRQNKPEVAV
ncbi:MAG: SAM-dependent chlorinase/fluorinase [Candidatus Lindowbacteria bacterium]|nr:SAM-dependent chlorinase/fluorinase [Candidatus Lindowbacteria bacterium]